MTEFKSFLDKLQQPEYEVKLPEGLRKALLAVEFEIIDGQPGTMLATYCDLIPLTHVEFDEKVLKHTVAQYRKYYEELIPIVEAKAAEICKRLTMTGLILESDHYEKLAQQLVQWSEEIMGGSIQFSAYLNSQPVQITDSSMGTKQVCLQFKFGIYIPKDGGFAVMIGVASVEAWETNPDDPTKMDYKQTLTSLHF